ncbi:hypothetical protein N9W00_01480 [Arcobacteraceae bacterium]|nr:hypothetical protein [Arcobacteraceae bacterium]
MKKLISSTIVIATLGVSLFGAELQSAKKLKSISLKATKAAIVDFKKDKKSKEAYVESKNFIADRLNKTASGGFYNIVYVNINSIYTKKMKYNKLSDKQKDMLESILKKELVSLGYQVQSAKYDNIGLHWAISWE